MHDELGDRMKGYEAESRLVLPSRGFMIIRADGRAFHSYTRGLPRPFDTRLMADMDAAALALAAEVGGAVLGYVQSDEISIIATDLTNANSQWWFGGSVAKVSSVAASVVTAAFAKARADLDGPPAHFDARVFFVDSPMEAHNYLVWRQADARRNAITMLAEHHIGKKPLHGVGTAERYARLLDVGVDPEENPAFIGGRLLFKETYTGPVSYVHKRTGETMTAEDVTRSQWLAIPAPRFTENRVLFAELDRMGVPTPYGV